MTTESGKRRPPVPSNARLDEMIEQPTVDAHGSSDPIPQFVLTVSADALWSQDCGRRPAAIADC